MGKRRLESEGWGTGRAFGSRVGAPARLGSLEASSRDSRPPETDALLLPTHRVYSQRWPSGELGFFQIAWVVDDLLRAASRWVEVYGVGPFHVLPRSRMSGRYRGSACTLELQTAVTQVGPVQFELIEPMDPGPNVYRELIPSGASGLHHFCTISRDFEATRAHYVGLDYAAITELQTRQGRIAYFDTTADFGVVTEVIEHSDEFVEAVSRISETCATWTGEDPIRLLERDGYRVPAPSGVRA
jgi:hypothetical protein